ncbi:MAG TPA: hypothetical protein VGF17_26870 [Phytomonospora sp.]
MPKPKLLLANGTVATQANSAITNDPDPLVRIGVDLYENRSIGANDSRNAAGGSIHTLYCRAGKVLRKSELDNLLDAGV